MLPARAHGANDRPDRRLRGRWRWTASHPQRNPAHARGPASWKSANFLPMGGMCVLCLFNRPLMCNQRLQPKTAFSRFPPVHRADPEGQQKVDSSPLRAHARRVLV